MANLHAPNFDRTAALNPQTTTSLVARAQIEATSHVHMSQTMLPVPQHTQLLEPATAVGYSTG